MMRIFSSLLGAALLASLPQFVSAQAGPALAEARGRVACGAGTLVSATYIGGGLLRVTCQQPNDQQPDQQQQSQSQPQQTVANQSVLGGTGLTAPVAGGAIASVVVISVLTGSDGTGTTTTTTETSQPIFVGER